MKDAIKRKAEIKALEEVKKWQKIDEIVCL